MIYLWSLVLYNMLWYLIMQGNFFFDILYVIMILTNPTLWVWISNLESLYFDDYIMRLCNEIVGFDIQLWKMSMIEYWNCDFAWESLMSWAWEFWNEFIRHGFHRCWLKIGSLGVFLRKPQVHLNMWCHGYTICM